MSFKDIKELYSKMWFNFSTKGSLIKKDHLDGMSINTNHDKIVTNKKFKRILNIHGLYLDLDKDIESIILDEIYDKYPTVDIIFNDFGKPLKINIKDKKITDEFLRAMGQYEYYKGLYDDLGRAEKKTGKKIKENGSVIRVNTKLVQTHKEKAESFEYIYEHEGSFFLYYKHIEVVCGEMDKLEKAVDTITSIIRREKCEATELVGELGAYLTNFSPSGYKATSSVQSIGMIMSDENIAHQTCYSESGIVGKLGLYCGKNLKNDASQFISFTEGTSGQVIAVDAPTGGGKTLFVTNQCFGDLCYPNHFISIMDYKGTEYTPMLNIYDGIEIKMRNKYVNFLNLSTIEDYFTNEEKMEFYEESINGTCSLFKAMVCLLDTEGSTLDLDRLVREAVIKVYSRIQMIKEQPDSYKLSFDIHYRDVLDVMKSMTGLKNYPIKERELLATAVRRINEFIGPMGSKRHLFSEEIDFASILHNRLVIYNFEKNSSSEDFTVEDNIRFQMMRFLNNKKTVYIKKMGWYFTIVYEELQRSGDGFIIREVNHDVTGGRSNNKKVYLLFNSLSFLLEGNKDCRSIASNVTTLVVGLVEEAELGHLKDLFNISTIVNDLNEMISKPEKYKHAFVMKINTGETIDTVLLRVDLPQDIIDSDLMKTRDVEE